MVRRIESASSGYRTVGYDPNPRGLSGTNPNNRRLAGTTATASDYKNAKKRKQDEKNENVKLGENPPYEDDDGFIPEHNGIVYFTEFDDEGNSGYKEELVVIGEGVEDTNGEGWTLSLRMAEKGGIGVLTARAGSSFHIQDVSDKGQIKLPTSPLENGMVKHDHKVIMPKTLRLVGWVTREKANFINGLIEYAELSKSLGSYFTLISPWKTYKKMYLEKYTSKANNKKYDVYDYTLDLSELLIASDLKDTTDDAELASNTDKGASSGK